MNSVHEFLRRILPNRLNLSRDDFSFELLRSASIQELKKHDNSRQQIMWPRPTSSHDNFHINAGKLVSFCKNSLPFCLFFILFIHSKILILNQSLIIHKYL
ncbi:unnamed protein product [Onchocerca flexuosa]|uniref:Uncharacterized protein n=1 Tax=Onchocerca flexuosa TaxID=387005 RepID=A0A183I652_9BILA|nr:unnamed protein product [Onchocerca flexuosa]